MDEQKLENFIDFLLIEFELMHNQMMQPISNAKQATIRRDHWRNKVERLISTTRKIRYDA